MPSTALQLTLTVFSKLIGYWPELSKMGYSIKRPNRGGVEDMEFPGGIEEKNMWKFQGSVKREVQFLGVYKKKLYNFHDWVSVLDLEISKDCLTVLQNFHG